MMFMLMSSQELHMRWGSPYPVREAVTICWVGHFEEQLHQMRYNAIMFVSITVCNLH